ncbi:MAG TPA: hypothetical protein VKY90_20795 [Candidatus Dormibacteraeota bacterium]|nr:hypothetical protein [Candidatus Dormibacteraeota bacterium]
MDSVQPLRSMIDREAASDVFSWARRHNTGVIAYSLINRAF